LLCGSFIGRFGVSQNAFHHKSLGGPSSPFRQKEKSVSAFSLLLRSGVCVIFSLL
jgi:hypothetical protein